MVICPGNVPLVDLAGYYSMASVYVQPSYYEGFGLPVLEAMSCGTPVICGRNGSLPEVAGKAATYVDTQNVALLAKALVTFIKENPNRR